MHKFLLSPTDRVVVIAVRLKPARSAPALLQLQTPPHMRITVISSYQRRRLFAAILPSCGSATPLYFCKYLTTLPEWDAVTPVLEWNILLLLSPKLDRHRSVFCSSAWPRGRGVVLLVVEKENGNRVQRGIDRRGLVLIVTSASTWAQLILTACTNRFF